MEDWFFSLFKVKNSLSQLLTHSFACSLALYLSSDGVHDSVRSFSLKHFSALFLTCLL